MTSNTNPRATAIFEFNEGWHNPGRRHSAPGYRYRSPINWDQTPQYGKIRDPRLDKGDFVFRVASESTTNAHDDTHCLAREWAWNLELNTQPNVVIQTVGG